MGYNMYVCPGCQKVFKVQGSNKKVKCSQCSSILCDINVSMEEWAALDKGKKDSIKRQVCSSVDNETITNPTPSISQVVSCPQCGTQNEQGSKFCTSCGFDFATGNTPVTTPAITPVVTSISPASQPQKSSSLFDGFEDKLSSTQQNVEKSSVNLMKCPSCGADIESNSKNCSYCGASITYSMRREQEQINKEGCPKCGSSNISFNREKQGEVKGKKGTAIVRRTVGVCKDCGHTWVTAESAPKKNKIWLWVLGWIFIFPIPLTILMLRKKDMKPTLKYGIIAAAWIIYLIIGKFGNTSDKKPEETKEAIETAQEEETDIDTPEENVSEDKEQDKISDSNNESLREEFNKKLGIDNSLWYDHVNNDVTGNWRELVVYSNKPIDEELAKEYYNAYFTDDNEVHFIVNLYLKTTTRINKYGDMLTVTCTEYQDKEETDAKQLAAGMELNTFTVNLGSVNNEKVIEDMEPIGEPIDVTLEVEPKVNADDGTVLFGVATNLPLKTEIMITVYNDNYTAQDKTVVLADGHGYTSEFSDNGNALKGDYNVRVTMVTPTLQDDTVKEIIGTKGENLTGQYVTDGAFEGEKTVEGEFSFSF